MTKEKHTHHHTHGSKCTHNHFDFSGIQNETLKKQATFASVGVASILIGVKVFAWVMTGSVSVLSSLADSFLDMVASLVNFVAVRKAMEPADREHRFGHGKIEPLAALGQAVLIFISVLFVLYESWQHIIDPEPIEAPMVGVVVMIISIILTFALVSFQKYVIRRTKSIAVTADTMHYSADMYLNLGVLFSIFVTSHFDILWFDALVGSIIAIYIVRTSWQIAVDAFHTLIDRELPDDVRHQIQEIITSHPEVKGFHNFKTRSLGIGEHVQVDIELDGKMPLERAHAIADEVQKKIIDAFPKAQVMIHQDPV